MNAFGNLSSFPSFFIFCDYVKIKKIIPGLIKGNPENHLTTMRGT